MSTVVCQSFESASFFTVCHKWVLLSHSCCCVEWLITNFNDWSTVKFQWPECVSQFPSRIFHSPCSDMIFWNHCSSSNWCIFSTILFVANLHFFAVTRTHFATRHACINLSNVPLNPIRFQFNLKSEVHRVPANTATTEPAELSEKPFPLTRCTGRQSETREDLWARWRWEEQH